ncbi:hypothetical protein NE237_014858 [Protea cynaroides]|uniref:Uncharacterized protein n=1 Tax=Protea cynaroides TaxID=273540 RepID=A0A9Q0QQH2_9MAGN|nr:hypothetical protein NE237_014858 [Protea cynaroides]
MDELLFLEVSPSPFLLVPATDCSLSPPSHHLQTSLSFILSVDQNLLTQELLAISSMNPTHDPLQPPSVPDIQILEPDSETALPKTLAIPSPAVELPVDTCDPYQENFPPLNHPTPRPHPKNHPSSPSPVAGSSRGKVTTPHLQSLRLSLRLI